MNLKISAILGTLLLTSIVSFKLYYDRAEAQKAVLTAQLQLAMDNQLLLENSIQKQNQEIENFLENEKQNKLKISELTLANNAAQVQVNNLKQKFAEHDLNVLSMAKPGLIERIVNRATAKVGKELEEITDPEQFNEDTKNTDTDSTS
jgi:hypothetical protein|tara:strand:+ start:362 stop:805 length:444 start_codon:yes stop_codon:yes gene_type:complete